ncbi:rho-associated protein kinase 1-like [Palaemon carinicauda]|uniref:rho-associated protein kinase 1-like n=1 Tax=Palaemon carinicauda TaxID=392227 RepID=UPI0035B6A79C
MNLQSWFPILEGYVNPVTFLGLGYILYEGIHNLTSTRKVKEAKTADRRPTWSEVLSWQTDAMKPLKEEIEGIKDTILRGNIELRRSLSNEIEDVLRNSHDSLRRKISELENLAETHQREVEFLKRRDREHELELKNIQLSLENSKNENKILRDLAAGKDDRKELKNIQLSLENSKNENKILRDLAAGKDDRKELKNIQLSLENSKKQNKILRDSAAAKKAALDDRKILFNLTEAILHLTEDRKSDRVQEKEEKDVLLRMERLMETMVEENDDMKRHMQSIEEKVSELRNEARSCEFHNAPRIEKDGNITKCRRRKKRKRQKTKNERDTGNTDAEEKMIPFEDRKPEENMQKVNETDEENGKEIQQITQDEQAKSDVLIVNSFINKNNSKRLQFQKVNMNHENDNEEMEWQWGWGDSAHFEQDLDEIEKIDLEQAGPFVEGLVHQRYDWEQMYNRPNTPEGMAIHEPYEPEVNPVPMYETGLYEPQNKKGKKKKEHFRIGSKHIEKLRSIHARINRDKRAKVTVHDRTWILHLFSNIVKDYMSF